jgi:all-trans-retinol dehydrogenase (NAD+)
MTDLRNARVLVTGAASGIGEQMAYEAAARGAQVIAWDVDGAGLERVADAMTANGSTLVTDVVDVTDRDAVYRAAAAVDEALGGVDVLILNAGIVDPASVLDVSDAMVDKVMGVNVMALFWCTKAFLPGMVERGDGHVVTIASITSIVPTPGMATYTVSKHAAYGFGETLRTELRAQAPGVKSTVVMPFFIATGMFEGAGTIPLPFFTKHLEPSEVAERVMDAVAHDKERVILPGIGVLVQVLRALPPRLYDAVADRVGLMSVMSTFTGRNASQSISRD